MAITLTVEPNAVSNASAWTVTSDKDDATAKTITVFADYSGTVAGTVKVTTSASHTYLTNDVIVITGTTNYNGTYDLTKIDADEFYITVTWVADDATGTTTLTNSNFRIKAELIISGTTVAVKWQPAGTLSWDFKRILWELITYTTIDFDSLNIITSNSNSYVAYTIKFTEYWESTTNALITGDDDDSDLTVIYKVDTDSFADYNLSADDEEFLTERPIINKIRIGDNLITGWTNHTSANAFDTFTTSGRNITSAIDSSAVNYALCYSSSIGRISKGDIVILYCNFTKNSGNFPTCRLAEGDGTATKSNVETFAAGYNYMELTATEDITVTGVMIRSEQAVVVDFSMSQVYVSKGYNELDYLGFVTEEANMDLHFMQYDINGNLLDTVILDEVAITGDRGIIPVSALLFTHSTTQVEKIILKALSSSTEKLLNGDFADWTGDNPDDWTVIESPADSEISEVGSDELHGGAGTESCNIYSVDDTTGQLYQDVLTIGKYYDVLVNVTKLDPSNPSIKIHMGSDGESTHISTAGMKRYVLECDGSDGRFILSRWVTGSDVTIDDVSVKELSDISKDITFIRNPVCWNNPIRIEWLNKFGAFDAYTFLDDYDEGRSGKRSTYKNTSDVEQILDIKNYQTIEAFSDYETKINIDWIKTILDSKKVYWIVDNERIEITVTGLSQVKSKRERIKLALSFRQLI